MTDIIFQLVASQVCEADTREDDPRNDMDFDELRDLRCYKWLSAGGKALIEYLWDHYPKMGAWPGSFDGGRTIDIKRNGVVFEICDQGGKKPFIVNIWKGQGRFDTFHIPHDSCVWPDATRHLAHIVNLVERGKYFGEVTDNA